MLKDAKEGNNEENSIHTFRVGNNNSVKASSKVYDVAENSVVWGAEVITSKNYICL